MKKQATTAIVNDKIKTLKTNKTKKYTNCWIKTK